MSTISKKICMVGDFGVGKTSLIRRFLDQQFSDHYLSTIGVKISRKQLSVHYPDATEQMLQLIIWDVEGKTQFQPIALSYLEGAMGAIIVADLNRKETVEHLPEHIALISAVNQKDMALIIALNKVDTLPDQTVSEMFQQQLSTLQENPQVIAVCLTSAKTGESVDQLFQFLAERLLQNHKTRHTSFHNV